MKKTNIFILIILILATFSIKVEAATIKKFPIAIDSRYVTKLYDNGTQLNQIGISGTEFFTVDDKTGYCIDFGTPFGGGWASNVWTPLTAAYSNNLRAYLINTGKFTESNVDAAIDELNLIYYYGYHDTVTSQSVSQTNLRKYLATQALIWETLSGYNMYKGLARNQVTDLYNESRLNEIFTKEGDKANITVSNVRFLKTVQGTIDSWQLINDNIVNVNSEKSAITTAIQNYYVKPSFCTNNTVDLGEMEINTNQNLTDINNVLSNYTVTCTGVNCTKEGRILTITAGNNEVANATITLSKTNNGVNSTAMVYQYIQGNQGVTVLGGALPTVSCTLKVKVTATPEEPSTPVKPACYLCGSGSTAEYIWSDTILPSCTLQEQYATQASCEKQNISSSTPEEVPTNPQTFGMRIAYIVMILVFIISITVVYFYSKKKFNN